MGRRSRIPWPLVRIFLLGALSVVFALGALIRYHTRKRTPMLLPSSAGTEVEAPELVQE